MTDQSNSAPSEMRVSSIGVTESKVLGGQLLTMGSIMLPL